MPDGQERALSVPSPHDWVERINLIRTEARREEAWLLEYLLACAAAEAQHVGSKLPETLQRKSTQPKTTQTNKTTHTKMTQPETVPRRARRSSRP